MIKPILSALRLFTLFVITFFFGCRQPLPDTVIKEAFVSTYDLKDNIDSPAVWHGPSGEHWIIATAKEGNVLVVYNASNGEIIRRIGAGGKNRGQFSRPNGIAVINNMALVVERDNHRVQVMSLPGFEHIGIIGEKELIRPYGLYIYSTLPAGSYSLYVTDDYESESGDTPVESKLGKRVKQFSVNIDSMGNLESTLIHSFGETSGDGVLRVVESIWGDPVNNTLLIAEEDERYNNIKVYTLDGEFTGILVGLGLIKYQAEGIVLWKGPGDSGYWVATDQGKSRTVFHLFDRTDFSHKGSFCGEITSNTDGIALDQTGYSLFSQGVLSAVNNDGGVAAFNLQHIKSRLGL